MRRLVLFGVVALVLVGMWMANFLSFGFFSSGDGSAGSTGITSVRDKGEPHPLIKDGVLKVRIEGDSVWAGGVKSSIDEISRIATLHQAKVSVERSTDALRRPREELEQALRDRNIHVVVE